MSFIVIRIRRIVFMLKIFKRKGKLQNRNYNFTLFKNL